MSKAFVGGMAHRLHSLLACSWG